MDKRRGLLISFEGIEGAGKSTQCRFLMRELRRRGLRVKMLREPGSSALGKKIRRILLHGRTELNAFAETLLFIAARAQLAAEQIRPLMRKNDVVIVDRYLDATAAYQGYGSGVDTGLIERLNSRAVEDMVPDITLVLDIDPKAGLKRCRGIDRFERRTIGFHNRVRGGYRALARKYPRRIRIIPADGTKEDVYNRVRAAVLTALNYKRKQANA